MQKLAATIAMTLVIVATPLSASAQAHRPPDRGHQVQRPADRGPQAERPSDREVLIRGIVSGLVGATRPHEPPRHDRRTPPPPPPRFEPPRHKGEFRGPPPRHATPWSPSWYRWCSQTYRSFNPHTGTFISKNGKERFCEVR